MYYCNTCVSFVELQPWTQFCITTGSINVNTAAYFRHHSPRNTNYVSWFSLFLFWSLMIMLVDIDSQLVCIIPLNGNNLTHFHFIHTNLVFSLTGCLYSSGSIFFDVLMKNIQCFYKIIEILKVFSMRFIFSFKNWKFHIRSCL